MDSINALPPILVAAISAQLECGYMGPVAVRKDLYQRYAMTVEHLNQRGSINSNSYRPTQVLPMDEYLPTAPAGWTQEDLDEAKNLRLEREMDERSGQ